MILVNIGGTQRPFKFGFNAIDIFCREHKIGIAEFGERFAQIGKGSATIGELRDIVYAGLAGGALSSGEPISFTCYQVGDWMDDLADGELSKMMEVITQSVSVSGKKKAVETAHSKTKEKAIGKRP
ncbi:MAG TPA: hypothetical protein VK806_00220 [Bacteroidia bacterium]|jgi:hypothetical protein|nr:hypothetical protein [Bacteroidia bacterium]